jgi:hypothetical protein
MAVSSRTILDIPPLPQKGTRLCWAACINMILNYLEHSHNRFIQGELSNFLRIYWGTPQLTAIDINDCNNYVVPSDSGAFSVETSNKIWNFDMDISNQAEQQFDAVFLENSFFSVQAKSITWDLVKKIIDDWKRPFIIVLEETTIEGLDTTTHAVVVRGFWSDNNGNNYLYINDPIDINDMANPTPYSLHFSNLLSGGMAMKIKYVVINIMDTNNLSLRYQKKNTTQTLTLPRRRLSNDILAGSVTDMYMADAVATAY